MRASEQEQTGGAGVSEVSGKFQRIGWGPVPNDTHDLGTDLLVQVRDHRRFDRGLIVGVQVKAGPSRFTDREVAEGALQGWWYYESGTAHFDDWVTHGLPHLLVLHDLEEDVAYWVHVTPGAVVNTGKGCKIMVPVGQVISGDQADALRDVAAQQKAAPAIEGTAFKASAQTVSPGRRIRFALLAPRLIAPHRNVGHSSSIAAEEALGLVVQGRFRDLALFAERHAEVPDLREPYGGKNWRWTLTRAVWRWLAEDEIDELQTAHESAPDGEAAAASGIVLTCALLRTERVDDALGLLDDLVDGDNLGPVDHGWALVQRSRIRAEIGDIVGARLDAAEAQRGFPGDKDDVTVSALASAASWQLFITAGPGHGDLADTLSASDTAIGWWRSQTIAWALDEASDRAFRSWGEDTSNRWDAEDAQSLNLLAAQLSADLTGEHGAWRAVSSLAARHGLMDAHRSGDLAGMSGGLDALRRAGDAASLKLAVVHLRRSGPIGAVANALSALDGAPWTHTTAKANLDLLALAGEFATEPVADHWLGVLVDLFEGKSEEFQTRVRPTFVVSHAASAAIGGLLPAASSEGRRVIAAALARLESPVDELLVGPVSGWIDNLEFEDLDSQTLERARLFGLSDGGSIGARVLGWLADHDDDEAKAEVHARAVAGDLDALQAMGDITKLTPEQAAGLIERFEVISRQTVEAAENGSWGFGGIDGARCLAMFNLHFPEMARFEALLTLLVHEKVAAHDKRGALEVLVELSDLMPDAVRQELARSVDTIESSNSIELLGSAPIGGLATAIAIATGTMSDVGGDVALARLALGSAQERCDAARLLGLGLCPKMRYLLASLVADPQTSVRQKGARAVGRLAASEPDAVLRELAQHLAADGGTIVPAALLVGLSQGDARDEVGAPIAEQLSAHGSARIRLLARDFLHTVQR